MSWWAILIIVVVSLLVAWYLFVAVSVVYIAKRGIRVHNTMMDKLSGDSHDRNLQRVVHDWKEYKK